jgi:pimeloyl-ACP methyl ester carboxylesterase
MLAPVRIASLSLVSTAARLENTVVRKTTVDEATVSKRSAGVRPKPARPYQPAVSIVQRRHSLVEAQVANRESIPKSLDVQIQDVKARLLNPEFIDQPDECGNFPTNGDRFAAQEINKRLDKDKFTRTGFICQLIAAGWHHKSAAQLNQLCDAVGRQRIMIMYGTIDKMITPHHSKVLIRELGGEESGVNVHVFEGKGHALAMEVRKEHNRLVAEFVDKAEALRGKE